MSKKVLEKNKRLGNFVLLNILQRNPSITPYEYIGYDFFNGDKTHEGHNQVFSVDAIKEIIDPQDDYRFRGSLPVIVVSENLDGEERPTSQIYFITDISYDELVDLITTPNTK